MEKRTQTEKRSNGGVREFERLAARRDGLSILCGLAFHPEMFGSATHASTPRK